MEYIFTFKNTNFAVKAEQILLVQGLYAGVIPLPPQIRAGCGICLRIRPDEIEQAIKILVANGIDGTGLFSREPHENGYIYTEITVES